jgi:hypothetical protein
LFDGSRSPRSIHFAIDGEIANGGRHVAHDVIRANRVRDRVATPLKVMGVLLDAGFVEILEVEAVRLKVVCRAKGISLIAVA